MRREGPGLYHAHAIFDSQASICYSFASSVRDAFTVRTIGHPDLRINRID